MCCLVNDLITRRGGVKKSAKLWWRYNLYVNFFLERAKYNCVSFCLFKHCRCSKEVEYFWILVSPKHFFYSVLKKSRVSSRTMIIAHWKTLIINDEINKTNSDDLFSSKPHCTGKSLGPLWHSVIISICLSASLSPSLPFIPFLSLFGTK